ncbi:hypothetical protein [Sneathiella sp.]|uniref:hypothetical protein n=1 Tax=Sneathiella sp. TaxID=1964365 RepID=UPI003565FE14
MIKLIIGVLALSLLAGTAFAADAVSPSIKIGNINGSITTGGELSVSYGTNFLGHTISQQNLNDVRITAPTFQDVFKPAGAYDYAPANNFVIGAYTHYDKNFTPSADISGWNNPDSEWTVNVETIPITYNPETVDPGNGDTGDTGDTGDVGGDTGDTGGVDGDTGDTGGVDGDTGALPGS